MNKIFKNVIKHTSVVVVCTALFSGAVLNGCKKEEVVIANQNDAGKNSVFSENTSGDAAINKLTGYYSVTGTRTLYIGSASDSVVNLVIDLAPYSPKIITSADARTLLCDYADLGYSGGFPLGYQYVITFYPRKKTFNVEPNEIMSSSIAPGSWLVYEKNLNPISRRFHFKTKYANSSSGYVRITDETLTWMSK